MATDEFVKFPRTPHLRDMGAATRDDLILSKDDALAMLARGVVVEEKVDGANLGISFGSLAGPPRCQKRGHWVTPKSEQQFSKLEGWLAQHEADLRRVLGTRFILYGEWVAARHSVPYDALPDWFLAYDLYDKHEGKFLSSRRRNELLRPTRVRSVPAVAAAPGRVFSGPDALEAVRQLVLGLRSALCVPGSEQWAEGVYLRMERDGWLVARAKLVHPNFLQAIEGGEGPGGGVHWSKREVQWNRLRPDLWMDPDSDPDPALENEIPDPVPGQGHDPAAPQDAAAAATAAAAPAAPAAFEDGGPRGPGTHADPARQARTQGPPAPRFTAPVPYTSSSNASAPRLAATRLELVGGGYYVALVGDAVDAVANCLISRAGCVPPGHVANRVARDGSHHHITLVTPPEMDELRDKYRMSGQEVYDRILAVAGPTGGAWLPLGLGRVRRSETGDEALFVAVAWPMGRAARAAVGLQAIQYFHITLGFNAQDVHGVPKGVPALRGGALDVDLLLELCAAAESAGAPLSQEERAAVLVWQTLNELQQTREAASSSSGAPPPPAAAVTPNVMDTLYGMLRTALGWATAAPNPDTASSSLSAAAAGPSLSRHFVASCAHVALARLAGLCNELDDVDEHVRHAEAALAAEVVQGHGGPPATEPEAAAGTGAVRPDQGCVVLAAAACLAAKACCQRRELGAAAATFTRAADLLPSAATAEEAIATATAAAPAGEDVMSLLRRAIAPSLDGPALRAAAASCARRAAAAAAASTSAASTTMGAVATTTGIPVLHPPSTSSSPSPPAWASSQRQHHHQHLNQQQHRHHQQQRLTGSGDRAAQRVGSGHAADDTAAEPGVQPLHLQHELQPPQLQQQRGSVLQEGQLFSTRTRTVVSGVAVSSAAPGAVAVALRRAAGAGPAVAVADVTLPRNTSWVVPGVLAGGSTPKRPEQIAALRTLGIDLVVTLTQEEPLPGDWFDGAAGGGVRNLFVPVTNYESPSVQQMDDILAAIVHHVTAAAAVPAVPPLPPADSGTPIPQGAVLVHCGGGKGRAGTVLACYLCKFGMAAPPPAVAAEAAEADPQTPANPPAMSAAEVVRLIRELRPGSIETEQQRRFVGHYCDILWQRYDQAMAVAAVAPPSSAAAGSSAAQAAAAPPPGAAVSSAAAQGRPATAAGPPRPPPPPPPASPPPPQPPPPPPVQQEQQQQQQLPGHLGHTTERTQLQPQRHPGGNRQSSGRQSGAGPSAPPPPPPRKLPRLVVLVGLPGSGKSTFSRALEASGRWSRICQDECGSRGAAESAFSAAMLRGPSAGWKPHLVLDRCSPDAADRREWFKLALLGRKERGIVAVFFDVDPATCKARVAARADHPTIAQGRGGRIVDSFAARLERPTTAEGFERVHVIRTPEDAAALLAAWGAAAPGSGGPQHDVETPTAAAAADDEDGEAEGDQQRE